MQDPRPSSFDYLFSFLWRNGRTVANSSSVWTTRQQACLERSLSVSLLDSEDEYFYHISLERLNNHLEHKNTFSPGPPHHKPVQMALDNTTCRRTEKKYSPSLLFWAPITGSKGIFRPNEATLKIWL